MEQPSDQNRSKKLDAVKGEIVASLKNDLLGIDEWKKSKIGFLTGYSAARKTGSSVVKSISQSHSRLRLLYDSLRQSSTRRVEGLETPEIFSNGSERFLAAQKLQNVTETGLQIIIRNTFWSFWLYVGIAFIYVAFVGASFYLWPMQHYMEFLGRLGPSPLIAALIIKSSYTNWVVRRRSADEFKTYVESCEWLPARN